LEIVIDRRRDSRRKGDGWRRERTYWTIAGSISFTPLGLIFNVLHISLAIPWTSSTWSGEGKIPCRFSNSHIAASQPKIVIRIQGWIKCIDEKDNGTMATRPKAELKRIEDEGVRGKDEETGRGKGRERRNKKKEGERRGTYLKYQY
jgi:hypothetical protein